MDDTPSQWIPKIQLPRMDLNDHTQIPLLKSTEESETILDWQEKKFPQDPIPARL